MRPGGRRLLSRIYLYSIVMLLLATGTSLVVGRYVLQPAFEIPSRPSTTWIARHAIQIQGQRERLGAELRDLREQSDIEMTLFTPDGHIVISNAETPPPPLSPGQLGGLQNDPIKFDDGRGHVAEFDERGHLRNYVVIGYPTPTPLGLLAGQLLVALAVLALLAIPLARFIALPVERLAELTRAFGRGDLSVRTAAGPRGDEIGDLEQAFDEMATRITELRKAERELLANVSHELRTPLSRIRLALELIEDGDARRAHEHLHDIGDELIELERLIDDVMATTHLDLAAGNGAEGLTPLHLETVEGDSLIEASRVRFRRHHPQRLLHLRREGSLPRLQVDPVLVRRALDNLLDNAVKFSEPNTTIELEADANASGWRIAVTDHGSGIAAHEHSRVFEPFYRTDKSRTRTTGGSGLGLALAKRIIEAHAGTLSLRSQPGAGSTFTITLPAHEESSGVSSA